MVRLPFKKAMGQVYSYSCSNTFPHDISTYKLLNVCDTCIFIRVENNRGCPVKMSIYSIQINKQIEYLSAFRESPCDDLFTLYILIHRTDLYALNRDLKGFFSKSDFLNLSFNTLLQIKNMGISITVASVLFIVLDIFQTLCVNDEQFKLTDYPSVDQDKSVAENIAANNHIEGLSNEAGMLSMVKNIEEKMDMYPYRNHNLFHFIRTCTDFFENGLDGLN